MFSDFCLMKNDRAYAKFIAGLKEGDRVGVQVFRAKRSSILNPKHQYWVIYEGEWTTGQVRYNDNCHPIRSDGLFCYHSSEEPYGEVFPDRIVQWHDEFKPRFEKPDRIYYSDGYIKSERPVYEPLWHRQSFFLDKYGLDYRSGKKLIDADKYPEILTHSWQVNSGTIIQVFDCGDYDFSEVPGYLYSENCAN